MYDMRLRPEQFWGLTPRLFSELSDRLDHDLRLRECQPSLIAAFFANLFTPAEKGKPKRQFKPEEFTAYAQMKDEEEEKPEPREMTPWEQFEYIRALNARLGGREEIHES